MARLKVDRVNFVKTLTRAGMPRAHAEAFADVLEKCVRVVDDDGVATGNDAERRKRDMH